MPPLPAEHARLRATSLGVGAMLAASGGFLDGFTYVGHGRVFANSMSANVILLGAYSYTGSWDVALRYLPPLVAFMAAVWASQAIDLHSRRRRFPAPYGAVLVLEIIVLLVLSLLPETAPDSLFTTSIAFAAAVQMATFREVNGRTYSSTFTTGNLRTLGEAAFNWLFQGRSPETAGTIRDFSAIVLSFLAGAIVGGVTTKSFGNRALWFEVIVLALIAIRVHFRFGPAAALSQSVSAGR